MKKEIKHPVYLTKSEINLAIAALLIYGNKCKTIAKENPNPIIYEETSNDCSNLENKLRKQFYETGIIT